MALSLNRSSFHFFGVDLAAAFGYLRDGWAEAMRWPFFNWLTPDDPVRVIHADGSQSVRLGVSDRRTVESEAVRFVAIELAEDSLLRRGLLLPRLSDEEVRQAVALDVRAASPFAESDLAWGFVADRGDRERIRVDIALTSRQLIDQQLAAKRALLNGVEPEVWVGGARPIVIPGYGESRRLDRARKVRLGVLLLIVLTAIQLVALALTPMLQSRQLAMDAQRRSDELLRMVQPQAKMREELTKLGEQVRVLTAAANERHDAVALLDEVTRRLPDDAVLSRFEINGSAVRLMGQADNAAQLLQTLSANPTFRDVRAPTGISRALLGGKEAFTIDFNLVSGAKPS